jgi:hypothetical protein
LGGSVAANDHEEVLSMRKTLAVLVVAAAVLTAAVPAAASTASFGQLYLNGSMVGTTVTPAPVPAGTGTDPFYRVINGVSGQLGIAGVGPSAGPYHGGDWQVFLVTFTGAPFLLTSANAVTTAQALGEVTVTRAPADDFRCPITQS